MGERGLGDPPGDLALWAFILSELAVFGAFFLAYGVARRADPALFAAGQAQLARAPALVATLLLISGSASAAAAVQAFAAQRARAGQRLLAATLATGLAFVVLKLTDLGHVAAAGHTLSSDLFWTFYLSLTVFHWLHVVLGLVVVAVVLHRSRRGDSADVENAAAYWHMVDLVWLVLFALLYVAR